MYYKSYYDDSKSFTIKRINNLKLHQFKHKRIFFVYKHIQENSHT